MAHILEKKNSKLRCVELDGVKQISNGNHFFLSKPSIDLEGCDNATKVEAETK